jgi:ATP-dependent helicase/nuclease subunit B
MTKPRPRVYSIPSGAPFADILAAGILQETGGTSAALADVLVLLPTRRACRSLREAFLRASDGRPLLLPQMTPIGDIDEDALLLVNAAEDMFPAAFDCPDAMSGLRRQLLLARQILALDPRGTTPEQAVHLAFELARLLDQVHTERLSFDALEHLVPEQLSEHWQRTLDFLEILTLHWPEVVAEEGVMDAAKRRNLLLEAQAKSWQKNPPSGLVIAAGSTGSIPATADLLSAVSLLPKGMVVLPGLDLKADKEAWAALSLDPTHPQYGMARLLDRFGMALSDVQVWPHGEETRRQAARERLINYALRPASIRAQSFDDAPFDREALEGVNYIDCPGPQEEASIIALIMRQTLEEEAKTAALITPDRALARRVAAELGRWNTEVDDSAGIPLARTPPGSFLRLSARLAAENMAPVSLLAVLKHPLAAVGLSAAACRKKARHLEVSVLRGARPDPGINALLRALPEKYRADLEGFLSDLNKAIEPFIEALSCPEIAPREVLRRHVAAAEALAETNDVPGAERLWATKAGEDAANFIAELDEALGALGSINGHSYPAVFDALMEGRTCRNHFSKHPRLHIWGLLEARLQQADVLILGGLNEGVWPPDARANPWMSRPMMESFGLPLPERRIGLAAHDFVQAFCAPEVVLTHAARIEGTPSVPSRWLMKLKNALSGYGDALAETSQWLHWQNLLDAPDNISPEKRPSPKPPLAARPHALPVTQIEVWMRDPYAIYARHILNLKALKPIDADPGASDYGTFIHDALDIFSKNHPDGPGDGAFEELLEIGRKRFGDFLDRPGVWAFWWPRFERIARWFVDEEKTRLEIIEKTTSETKGTLDIDGGFVLSAKADRIDRLSDGTLAIIDYKTGYIPSEKEIAAGFSPQLPLEAVIAQAGKFEGVAKAPVSTLEYWALKGGNVSGARKPIKKDVDALCDEALAGLRKLIAAFDDENTPYLARPRADAAPRYGDYEHLARIKEWSAGSGEDGEGDAS